MRCVVYLLSRLDKDGMLIGCPVLVITVVEAESFRAESCHWRFRTHLDERTLLKSVRYNSLASFGKRTSIRRHDFLFLLNYLFF